MGDIKTAETQPFDEAAFSHFVDAQIQPIFDALQVGRARGFARLRLFGAIGMVIGVGVGGWLYIQQPKVWPLSIVVALVFGVLGMIPGWISLAAAKDNFGALHVGKIAKFMGLDHTPEDFEPPRFGDYNTIGLVPKGDRRQFSNLVTGSHEGTQFSVYEAKIEERRTRTTTDKDGNTRTETYWEVVFHGQLLQTPIARKFACTTVIARDHGWFNTKGRFGKTMKPMGLADPHFEKIFEVYTTDQVEGRYLVDPIFMTRLLALEDNHKKRKITAVFYQQSVLVALQGGTDFFGKLDKKASARSLAEDTVAAFKNIFSFLDMLKGKGR